LLRFFLKFTQSFFKLGLKKRLADLKAEIGNETRNEEIIALEKEDNE